MTGPRRELLDRIARGALALLCAWLLWAARVSPGWHSWPLLSEELVEVDGTFTLALSVALVANAFAAARWPSALAVSLFDAAMATMVLVLLARLFVIFPFDVAPGRATIALRVVLGIGMLGAFVGLVASMSDVSHRLHKHAHLHGRGVRPRGRRTPGGPGRRPRMDPTDDPDNR